MGQVQSIQFLREDNHCEESYKAKRLYCHAVLRLGKDQHDAVGYQTRAATRKERY